MANYRTHVTVGTGVGIVVAGASAVWIPGVGWDALFVGVFFGFIGGMIPDLDHDTGLAIRKISALLSTFVPMLVLAALSPKGGGGGMTTSILLVLLPCHYLLHWTFSQLPWWRKSSPFRDTTRAIVVSWICALPPLFVFSTTWGHGKTWLAMGGLILAIHMCVPLFKYVTVHRGVFHTIPTTLIYGALVYLLFSQGSHFTWRGRLVISLIAWAGALSHLILDEMYSVDFNGAKLRVKRSFGTAFSFWKSDYPFSSLFAYILTALLLAACVMTT